MVTITICSLKEIPCMNKILLAIIDKVHRFVIDMNTRKCVSVILNAVKNLSI